MNGREWLARQLEQSGIGFERHGNKILHVDNFNAMQPLLEKQLETNWVSLLDGFVPVAFPTFTSTLGTDHWHDSNSVKMYNELNNLRIESTINAPGAFRAYRRKQGAGKNAPKQLLPLRKGVADTTLRARVSQGINDRFADHVGTTRAFRLLRDHGVIRRLPKSRRYQLTSSGRELVTTLQAALTASAQELVALAA